MARRRIRARKATPEKLVLVLVEFPRRKVQPPRDLVSRHIAGVYAIPNFLRLSLALWLDDLHAHDRHRLVRRRLAGGVVSVASLLCASSAIFPRATISVSAGSRSARACWTDSIRLPGVSF